MGSGLGTFVPVVNFVPLSILFDIPELIEPAPPGRVGFDLRVKVNCCNPER